MRDNGGHAVALRWSMPNVYDVAPGDVFWAASDVGWVVGHSYIVYAPLLTGATTVLYEGKPVGTPDAGAFWRVVARAQGQDAVHRADRVPRDPQGRPRRRPAARLRPVRRCATCSSPASGSTRTPDAGRTERLGIPVVDHWWQTETGWPIAANLRGLEPMPIKPGSPTMPGAGLRRAGGRPGRARRSPPGIDGEIVIKLPLPPGTLPTLWGDDERFVASYLSALPGYYLHRRRRLRRRRRLPVRHGPHRRRHQRRRAPAVHRRDRGGRRRHPAVAECAVIGVHRRAEGPGAARVRGAQGRRGRRSPTSCATSWSPLVRERDRPDRRAAAGRRGAGAAQDPVGQDPARHDARRSPTAATSRCRRPSRTRPCSTGCGRCCRAEGRAARPTGARRPRPANRTRRRTARRARPRVHLVQRDPVPPAVGERVHLVVRGRAPVPATAVRTARASPGRSPGARRARPGRSGTPGRPRTSAHCRPRGRRAGGTPARAGPRGPGCPPPGGCRAGPGRDGPRPRHRLRRGRGPAGARRRSPPSRPRGARKHGAAAGSR